MKVTEYTEKNGGYILADIMIANLPNSILVEDDILTIRPEFHITLLSFSAVLEQIANGNSVIDVESIRQLFLSFSKTHDLCLFSLTDELRYVKRRNKASLVIMVQMPMLQEFYQYVNSQLGTSLPPQPAHVTLYVRDASRVGIPLNSASDVEEFSHRVRLPELATVCLD